MMRSVLFNALFLAWTFKSVLVAYAVSVLRGENALRAYVKYWASGVRFLMRWVAGVTVQIRGSAFAPQHGPALIAAKHQSYGDGIIITSLLRDVVSISDRNLAKKPLLGPLLNRLGTILVDTCGETPNRRQDFEAQARVAKSNGRSILIYPEGRLVPVGEAGTYKSGIYHLYADLGLPVTPVATNLGRHWVQNRWRKHPGIAVVEFLEPIAPGLSRGEFMSVLRERIESRTRQLEAEPA
jgi:1-acyl-sn-glycerol-3-phosphate acyltransferase